MLISHPKSGVGHCWSRAFPVYVLQITPVSRKRWHPPPPFIPGSFPRYWTHIQGRRSGGGRNGDRTRNGKGGDTKKTPIFSISLIKWLIHVWWNFLLLPVLLYSMSGLLHFLTSVLPAYFFWILMKVHCMYTFWLSLIIVWKYLTLEHTGGFFVFGCLFVMENVSLYCVKPWADN